MECNWMEDMINNNQFAELCAFEKNTPVNVMDVCSGILEMEI